MNLPRNGQRHRRCGSTVTSALLFSLTALIPTATLTGQKQVAGRTPLARTFRTNDTFRLSIRYPDTWSALRRGNEIVLWSTVAASAHLATNASLDSIEGSATQRDRAVRGFVIVTVRLVSGFDDSLQHYAEYVTNYAETHPLSDDGTQLLTLKVADVESLSLAHVVRGNRLFVQLDNRSIATLTIRTDKDSAGSLEPVIRQALDVLTALQVER